MTRRPDGTLEHDVLAVLWASDRPLLPGEVNERLGQGHAYTSIATVLSRLQAKGLVQRQAVGRAFTYTAAIDQSDLAVRRIDEVLAATPNRSQVLARFVGQLSPRDARLLRKLLQQDEPQ